MSKLAITLGKEAVGQVVTLAGGIVEGAARSLSALKPQLEVRCCFDLAQVTLINSCGVAEWIEFLEDIGEGRILSFRACSPVVVNMLNLIQSFAQRASVLSVQIPYRCDGCRTETVLTLAIDETLNADDKATLTALETAPCGQCGRMATAGVMIDDYFAFLQDPA